MHKDISSATARKFRIAASAFFLIDGIGFGVWAALLPSLQQRLSIDDKELSIILLAMVAGALAAMGGAGHLISRHGSRTLLRWVAPAFCVVLCGPVVASNFAGVALAAVLFGAFKGSLDVTVNAHSIAVQQLVGRSILSSFQALWSFGGLGAAAFAALALKGGVSPLMITGGTAVVLFLLSICFSRRLLNDVPPKKEAPETKAAFNPRLWPIGILAFASLFAEGVMMDWSAIYSERVALASAWLAPLAYGVFCIAMAGGRLAGDALIMRFSAHGVLRYSCWLSAGGLILMVLVPVWPVTFCGLVAVGFGLANMVPIFLGSASRIQPSDVGRAVASVSMIGYVGLLAGPPVVGMISHWMSLTVAFGMVGVLVLLIGLKGPSLLPRETGVFRKKEGQDCSSSFPDSVHSRPIG